MFGKKEHSMMSRNTNNNIENNVQSGQKTSDQNNANNQNKNQSKTNNIPMISAPDPTSISNDFAPFTKPKKNSKNNTNSNSTNNTTKDTKKIKNISEKESMEIDRSEQEKRINKKKKAIQKYKKLNQIKRQQFIKEFGITPEEGQRLLAKVDAIHEREELIEKQQVAKILLKRKQQENEEPVPKKELQEIKEQVLQFPLWLKVVYTIDGWDNLEHMQKNYPPYSLLIASFGDEGKMINAIDVSAMKHNLYTADDIIGNDETQFLVNKMRFLLVAATYNKIETEDLHPESEEELIELIEFCSNIYEQVGTTLQELKYMVL